MSKPPYFCKKKKINPQTDTSSLQFLLFSFWNKHKLVFLKKKLNQQEGLSIAHHQEYLEPFAGLT